MQTRHLLCTLAAALVVIPAGANPAVSRTAGFDLGRTEIRAFIDEVAERNTALDRDAIYDLLAKAEPQPRIVELMSRPAERVVPWWEYRERFVNEPRINGGAKFWREHRQTLERISAEHGVPPQYIVAIIGVETLYGRITGGFRVLDALTTLAFDYPPRSDFFRRELEQFLLLTGEEDVDPLKITGSYAGAMGAPQFMPSSYRRYAIDGGNDQRRDLWEDWDDVIASVANYFREHGWEPGGPVVVEATLDPDATFQLDKSSLELNATLDSLSAEGVQVALDAPGATPAVVVSAEQQDGPAYRVGFQNFYVITRYNRSSRYAMAVHDLAEAITQRVQSGGKGPKS